MKAQDDGLLKLTQIKKLFKILRNSKRYKAIPDY